MYVKDTAEGFVRILESRKTEGKVINIATKKEISIGDLSKRIIKLCGSRAKIDFESIRKRPGKSEVERLLGDNKELIRLTGWKPETSIDTGLKNTIEWFRNSGNMKLYKPDTYAI